VGGLGIIDNKEDLAKFGYRVREKILKIGSLNLWCDQVLWVLGTSCGESIWNVSNKVGEALGT
jgi:hypothetical protein